MSNYQIPFPFNFMASFVHCLEKTISVQQRGYVLHDVPFRVPPTTSNNIARIGFVSELPKFFCYGLALFASNQHFHY